MVIQGDRNLGKYVSKGKGIKNISESESKGIGIQGNRFLRESESKN